MTVLYHYTDTARLPWIIQSGELRPGRNAIGGFPQPDFLWATSDPQGDRTASAHRGDYWRRGALWHARFVLDPADFLRWADNRDSLPGWTADHVGRLEAAKGASPSAWWYREASLPLSACRAVEVRSYAVNRWRQALLGQPIGVDGGAGLSITIGTRVFASAREAGAGPGGGDIYDIL